MANEETKTMLRGYVSRSTPRMFLSGMFQSPPENYFNTEKVEFDIMRSGEEVAIVITDMNTGSRMNSDDEFANKEFTPPIYSESFALSAFDAMKRQFGENSYVDPRFEAAKVSKSLRMSRKIREKIMRGMELQASQIIQTGKVSLTDSAGLVLYELDYKPKTSHFTDSSAAWDGGSAAIEKDIVDISEVIRDDGLDDPDELLMGSTAYRVAMNDSKFKEKFFIDRSLIGRNEPMKPRGDGGFYRGYVELGNYRFDIYTYGARYNHPQTGTKTQFIDPKKVVVRSSGARMDTMFGAVPLAAPVDPRAVPYLPTRISESGRGIDFWPNAYISQNNKQIMVELACRPLLVPTAINTFGCINTQIT